MPASFYTEKMLVLASQSPRRSEILRQAGIFFTVRVVGVDESVIEGEAPVEYVQRLAEAKARAVDAADEEVVLGADTTVVIDGEILGKPEDAEDARRMLRLLSGRRHEVMTGICLRRGDAAICGCERTAVVFAHLSESEIAEYVESGEPMDKAGAYAIQGLASKFVEGVEGDFFNVVGLPVALVYRYLREWAGYNTREG
jgi:septum formation protein